MAFVGIALADAYALPTRPKKHQESERLISGLIVPGPLIIIKVDRWVPFWMPWSKLKRRGRSIIEFIESLGNISLLVDGRYVNVGIVKSEDQILQDLLSLTSTNVSRAEDFYVCTLNEASKQYITGLCQELITKDNTEVGARKKVSSIYANMKRYKITHTNQWRQRQNVSVCRGVECQRLCVL